VKSTQKIKLEVAIQNSLKYISTMSRWSDKKLEKHLDLFRIQKAMALKQKKYDAFELLSEYEDQVIQARLRKI
jgi:hypothetical protein